MSGGNLRRLDAGTFLDLVNQCGLELRELDLAQLSRRKIVSPVELEGMASHYTELHLFVVAQYMLAVRPIRHPWSSRAGRIGLDEVSELGRRLNRLLGCAFGEAEEESGERAFFFRDLEDYLARIDPYGPLGEVFDLVRPDIRERIRNTGRLYLELRGGAAQLAQYLEEVNGEVDSPMTRPMFESAEGEEKQEFDELRSTQVMGEEEDPRSAAARQAIDSVMEAASKGKSAKLSEEDEADVRATQLVEIEVGPEVLAPETEGLREESSDPIVLRETAGEEASHVKDRAGKGGREEKIGSEEEERVEVTKTGGRPPDLPRQEVESPARRIAELNRLRRSYLKEQKWEKLAELYEDGMDLFREPAEKQQVYLVLAMLYEMKMGQKQKAFEAFSQAWELREVKAGREKAFEGLQRLGRTAGLQERYMEWAQKQLTTKLSAVDRGRLQGSLSLALYSDEQYQRAYLTYAAYLAEDPSGRVSEESLEQLTRLGAEVEPGEVQSFLAELLTEDLDEEIRALVEGFVGR